jgi:protein involved in polysaccharide export with SLBB domain
MIPRLLLLCALSNLVCAPAASNVARARSQQQQSQQSQPGGEDDPSAPAGWKRYRYRYGSGDTFSFVFPQAPQESTSSSDTPDGKVVVHFLQAQSAKGLYFAACIEVQTKAGLKITPEARRVIYERFWANFSDGMKSGMEQNGVKADVTPLDPKKISVSGREGQEQEFTVRDLHGRYRAATGESQVYVIVAISTAGWPSDELETFSDSFKILAP